MWVGSRKCTIGGEVDGLLSNGWALLVFGRPILLVLKLRIIEYIALKEVIHLGHD
jgi:hypothetical protein